MTKRLFFGGSFNPIHMGHLICARAAAERGGFDTVVLVPAAQSPHKPAGIDLASSADRLAMCRLAVDGTRGFEVSDYEIREGGVSYTLKTVRHYASEGTRISWLIGADQLPRLPVWHEAETLLREADFYVLARPGWTCDWPALPPSVRPLQSRVLPAPLIDISASEIRRRRRAGLRIDFLTPAPVVRYIEEKGLYES